MRRDGVFERYADLSAAVVLDSGQKSSDFDGNGSVGFEDFLIFAIGFRTNNIQCNIDGDGSVGFADFLLFAFEFGK